MLARQRRSRAVPCRSGPVEGADHLDVRCVREQVHKARNTELVARPGEQAGVSPERGGFAAH